MYSEEQSPTLMIQALLDELAPQVETIEALGVQEEEGSSTTPEKEDDDEDDVVDEDQVGDASKEKIEDQIVIRDE